MIEGTDPCKCQAVYCSAAQHCQPVPITSFRTPPRKRYSAGINDDEGGLHHDDEVWLEGAAPHSPIEQYWHNRTGEDSAYAHLKRQVMGREVMAVTNGRLDGFALLTRTFGTWERICYGEFDDQRRKRVLIKNIGEQVAAGHGFLPWMDQGRKRDATGYDPLSTARVSCSSDHGHLADPRCLRIRLVRRGSRTTVASAMDF